MRSRASNSRFPTNKQTIHILLLASWRQRATPQGAAAARVLHGCLWMMGKQAPAIADGLRMQGQANAAENQKTLLLNGDSITRIEKELNSSHPQVLLLGAGASKMRHKPRGTNMNRSHSLKKLLPPTFRKLIRPVCSSPPRWHRARFSNGEAWCPGAARCSASWMRHSKPMLLGGVGEARFVDEVALHRHAHVAVKLGKTLPAGARLIFLRPAGFSHVAHKTMKAKKPLRQYKAHELMAATYANPVFMGVVLN